MIWTFYQALDLNLADNQRDLLLLSQQLWKVKNIEFLVALTSQSHWETKNPEKYTWYNETENAFSWTLSSNVDNATLDFVVNHELALSMKPWYVVKVEDEQLVVDVVNTTTDTITFVSRWDAWTGAVAHTAGVVVDIIWKTEWDWTITSDFVLSWRVRYENYFQEFTHTIELTQRALESSNKDRESLLLEERIAVMTKHLQFLNKAIRMQSWKYDTVEWKHIVNWYENFMLTNWAVSQTTLWYSSGAFDYDDFKALQLELMSRSSDAMFIHCNASTKNKLLSLVPDKYYVKNIQDAGNNAGAYFDWIIAEARDGRILRFIIDNSISGSQFALLDMDSFKLIPRKALDGTDKMYKITPETEDSSKMKETLRSQFTLKYQYPSMNAVLKNI